jgi:hypothetical protein
METQTHMHKGLFSQWLGVVVVAATCTGVAQAQSSDALLNKLVQKGVLTQTEADELKKETDAGFDKAYRSRTGLPDWVTQLKVFGDVRGRVEGFWTENNAAAADSFNNDRWRMRYRLRAGMIVTMKDNLELGFRLTSDEPVGNFGGDPISANTTFQDNGSKKFIFVDQAYGRWTPFKRDSWSLTGTIGKMENPFSFSTMVFDDDYTPEGVALQSVINLNKSHVVRLNGGFFWLDEIAQGSDSDNDSFLLGAQARWDAKWSECVDSSLGFAILAITDEQSLTNFAVPNINVGNTRFANGALVHDYTPLIVDAAVGYTFNSAPYYKGKFPIRAIGTFMHNPGAPNDNDGYEAGIVFGKAGKKQTWEASYRWRRLEADAWYEEITDSDVGAFYQATPASFGLGPGYRAGTGLQGHIFKASYSPYDAFTFNVTYYWVHLIDEPVIAGSHAESGQSRLQVDAVWKF